MFHVVEACCTFLENQIDPSNVIGIANFAQQNGCIALHTKATAYIEQHFTEVATNKKSWVISYVLLLFLPSVFINDLGTYVTDLIF